MPLITALFEALAAACKAYCAHVEWQKKTHVEETLYDLENEKLRLGESGSPADLLRLELIAARIHRLERQGTE